MRKLLVLVLAGVISFAGCSSTSTNSVTSTSEVNDVSTSEPEPSGSAFALIGGGTIDLTRGPTAKPMALWFWAPGWGLCNFEAPSVEEAHKKFGDKVSIVGVAWQGSSRDYQDFLTRHSLTFPNIDDSAADVFGAYQVRGQPAWAMVKPTGEVEIFLGALSDDELAEQLTLLSQP